jgi:hypothetical protein
VLNHADHLFWLGISVADTVINQRSVGLALSRDRRSARHNTLLAIPLTDAPPRETREQARVALGIPDSQLVLLSVGRSLKYKPSPTHDFFRSAATLLHRHADAHVYVLGPTPDEALRYSPFAAHPRLHVLGPIENAGLFQSAADIYLESFPFGSQTACLESCLRGVPAVLAYRPASALIGTTEECIAGLVANPSSEEEHAELIAHLIRQPVSRRALGAELRSRLLEHHTGERWLQCLEDVYASALRLSHRHGAIPRRTCQREPLDLSLSSWLDALSPAPFPFEHDPALAQFGLDLAYQLRQHGDYTDAFRVLNACRRRHGLRFETAMAAAKLAPHWVITTAQGLSGRGA